MYNILFRVDGSSNIGMGHVMRSLTIAKEFKKMNCNVIFISKYKEGIKKILEEGFEVRKLKLKDNINSVGFHYGDASELEGEIEDIKRVFACFEQIDLLLIDSYNVTDKFFLEMKKYVNKLAYIDDLDKFCEHIDILINGNVTANDMGYQKYREDQVLFLGTKYNLIRDEFKNLPKREINSKVRKVMITTGGSDPYHITSKLLNIFLEKEEYKNLEFSVIVGQGFRDKGILEAFSEKHPNVVLRKNVKYMSKIMMECDIAISAGGGTLYELCSCGTPTIAFIVAENQEKLVNKLNELKYIESIGWHDSLTESNLIPIFDKFFVDENKRKSTSLKGQALVDGLGGTRIVMEIIDNLNTIS